MVLFTAARAFGQPPRRCASAQHRQCRRRSGLVVGLFQQDGSNGWSEDWGRTFTALAPPPGQASWLPGGDCAVSTRGNIIIAQGDSGSAWWTKNGGLRPEDWHPIARSEEPTSELQSLMRLSYAVFCLKKKT